MNARTKHTRISRFSYALHKIPTPREVANNVYRRAGKKRGDALPAFTSIGCYTLVYYCKGGDVLCAACASKNKREGYECVIDVGTYDEGPTLQCDDCNSEIESSYGDPDENENEAEAAALQLKLAL